ncbi:hypothetical protein ACRAWF_06375 [Streptomyces sp. L7]
MTEFQAWSFKSGEDVLVVGDQTRVDGGGVAGGYEAQGGVAGGGDGVVLAGLHQLDHLVGAGRDLGVDLAARLLLEVADPVDLGVVGAVLDIAGPGDQVDLALALAELRLGFEVRGLRPPDELPDESEEPQAVAASRTAAQAVTWRVRVRRTAFSMGGGDG